MRFLVQMTSLLVTCMGASDPALKFVGIGYNLLTGNPDGGVTALGGVDPGLLITRNVLEIGSGADPDEVEMESRQSCTDEQQDLMYYGTKSYQDKLSVGVKATGNVGIPLASVAFTLSGRYANTKESVAKNKEVYFDQQTVCNLGRLRFMDEFTTFKGFSVTESFAASICMLPETYNQQIYMNLLDQWGTHVITQVEYGTKLIKRYKTTLSEFLETVRKEGGVEASLGGSYMGYGASLGVDVSKLKSSEVFNQNTNNFQYTLTSGTPELPEPIGITIVSIDMALNPKYWASLNPMLLAKTNCATSSLETIRGNIIQALENYAAFKMVSAPTDPQLKIPVTWPKGTYGLMKAQSGCPAGKVTWHEGWRYQDVEDMFNDNTFSDPLNLAGKFGDDIKYEFCMKGDTQTSDYDMIWPAGDYCLLKYGDCPAGFEEGWVYWNDDYYRNKNDKGGSLPDGVFDTNTKIYYCCRDDAVPTQEMPLPTDEPFYLIHFNRGCQLVTGMKMEEEFVKVDAEDSFGDKSAVGGASPKIDDLKNPKMYFCYYTPK